MKKLLLLSFAFLISAAAFTQAKKDTLKTVAVFIEPYQGRIITDYVFKTFRDTTKLVEVGKTGTFKKVTSRDTVYFVPTVYPAIDAVTKKQKVDSTGAPLNNFQWIPVSPANIIMDFMIRVRQK